MRLAETAMIKSVRCAAPFAAAPTIALIGAASAFATENREDAHCEAALEYLAVAKTDAITHSYYEGRYLQSSVPWLKDEPRLVPIFLAWSRDHNIYGSRDEIMEIVQSQLNANDMAALTRYFKTTARAKYVEFIYKLVMLQSRGSGLTDWEIADYQRTHFLEYTKAWAAFEKSPLGTKYDAVQKTLHEKHKEFFSARYDSRSGATPEPTACCGRRSC
jgi:hypothetical protein